MITEDIKQLQANNIVELLLRGFEGEVVTPEEDEELNKYLLLTLEKETPAVL
jgi:hypothetical protein